MWMSERSRPQILRRMWKAAHRGTWRVAIASDAFIRRRIATVSIDHL
jgi:hypothetical protein